MSLVAIGVDHRTAPVDLRAALAFDEERARRFLLGKSHELSERLLLSTCNRTELFVVHRQREQDPIPELLDLLKRACDLELPTGDGVARVMRGEDAVRHLFRVACGIESMVLGETQILGQVKDAAELASQCGTAGPLLQRVLEAAVRVARKSRAETAIGEGAVSVASVAVDVARKMFDDLQNRHALVIGAGETGRLVAQHLKASGIGTLTVANRTLGRAMDVAGEVGGAPAGLCGVPPALRDADIVVCSTAAKKPILTYEEMKAAMKVRKGRMILMIDIAVPRDIEEKVGRLEGVFHHDIDALARIMDRNLENRRKAVPRVEEMVEEAVRAFQKWERGLEVVPAIKALRERFEEIRRDELDRNLKRIPEAARPQAERLTESLLNRVLHGPMSRLHRAADEPGQGKDLVAALRELFDMEEETRE
jgi:glutamyl-tRNA reductase